MTDGMCAKCGQRHATQAILTMVERPGATLFYCDECARGPQWTTTPPTEPGWYWCRINSGRCEPIRVLPGEGEYGDAEILMACLREFWPVPIAEPPE